MHGASTIDPPSFPRQRGRLLSSAINTISTTNTPYLVVLLVIYNHDIVHFFHTWVHAAVFFLKKRRDCNWCGVYQVHSLLDCSTCCSSGRVGDWGGLSLVPIEMSDVLVRVSAFRGMVFYVFIHTMHTCTRETSNMGIGTFRRHAVPH